MKPCPDCAEELKDEAVVCRFCGRRLTEVAPQDRVLGWISDHTALALSLVTFLFIVFQVARISEFDVATMQALVQSGSPSSLVSGLLVSQFPFFMSILAVAASWWFARSVAASWVPALAVVLVVFVALFTVPWPFFLALVVVAVSCLLLGLRKRAEDRGSGDSRGRARLDLIVTIVAVTAAVVLFAFMMLRKSVWIPSEALYTTDGARLVGFVVQDQGGWTTVLTPDARVLRLASETIIYRRICSLGESGARALRLRPLQALTFAFTSELPESSTPLCSGVTAPPSS